MNLPPDAQREPPEWAQVRAETRLHRAHAALLHLARSQRFQGDNLIDDLRQISEVAARALEVARVSVWLHDRSRTKIRCIDLFVPAIGLHTDGDELHLRDHPAYFLALESQRLIVAHDALFDIKTREYAFNYLEPLGITSMLDAAARLRGELVGVICLEHIGPPRTWTTEEEVFACALADLVSLALEASERQAAEVALRESEQRFREILENTRDAVAIIRVRNDGAFLCEALNPAAESVSGLRTQVVMGCAPHEFLPAAVAEIVVERCRALLHSEMPATFEHELPLPAGPRWFSTDLIPIRQPDGRIYRIAAIARDITDRVRGEKERQYLQARLHQAQKLEALGTLAGGVSHDFNNLLTGILGNADLLLGDVTEPEARDRVTQIVEISMRARDLVRQILAFSRNEKPVRAPVVLGTILQSAIKYLRVLTPPGIDVRLDLPDTDHRVLADATQMYQVVINLCTNAIQALAGGSGTVRVGLASATVGTVEARSHGFSRPGEYAMLSVEDNGCGMEQATVQHLFEPFFTTKPHGQGTGLGLAVVYGIVQEHEGVILVSSRPGHGTTFKVYLPLLPADEASLSAAPAPLRLGGGERVLFLDDQPFIANLGQTTLRRLGYRADVFTDPLRALAAFQADPSVYHVVVTDYSMPQMSGVEFARAVLERNPNVPVLLLTGFQEVLDQPRLALAGIREVIGKPFTLEALAAVLAKVIVGR